MASASWSSGAAEGSLRGKAWKAVIREWAACSKDFRDRKSLKGDMGDEEAKDPGGRGTGWPLYLAVESARSLLRKMETQKTRRFDLQRTRASDWRLMDGYQTKG